MKTTMRFLCMAALFVTGALMAGCSDSEEILTPSQPENDNIVTLTTTISLDGGDATRALDASGVKTFAAGDKIALIYKDNADQTLKAESLELETDNITDGGKSAVFTVEVNDPKAGSVVKIIYPAAMAVDDVTALAPADAETVNYAALATQDGTLASIASNLDVCTFDGMLTSENALPANIVLTNQLVIGKFTLKNADSSADLTSSITKLSVFAGGKYYTVTRAAAAGPIWVAMEPVTSGNISFTATDGTNYYEKNVTGKTLEANNLYPIGLKMNTYVPDVLPLTFEAKDAGATVKFTFFDGFTGTVEYSTDGLTWNGYTSGTEIVLANIGDKVMFRGDNETYSSFDESEYEYKTCRFSCGADCYIYGNIMSLVSSNDFEVKKELTERGTFESLFRNNSHILIHAIYPLLLPAMTLSVDCYAEMFRNSKSLTSTPVLPATTLAEGCYSVMFAYCSNLTSAPDLPAPTLAVDCYSYMFYSCKSLTAVTCLATDISAQYCTEEWVYGVSKTGTFTKVEGMNDWPTGKNGIPKDWQICEVQQQLPPTFSLNGGTNPLSPYGNGGDPFASQF